ncbi:MAG TPA: UTP--glucose-1-phosphate uridylyltransferase [Candidatus Saccharimonadales bacterium]|nr:UTP--glucose-1-phosphate uridylyltransferase [Candidatus Saccharimonadales bacterium]
MTKVRKAIVAAAGMGTRFLPQTKAMPKEMLPIVDKPVIQIIVEQLVAAGVTDVIIVTGSNKRAVEDHFDRSEELENELRQKGKDEFAEQIKEVAEMANFIYLRQKGEPKGNARPLLNARHLIGDEPFFVVFADDFFRCDVPYPQQLLNTYEKTGQTVISLTEVQPADSTRLGMVVTGEQIDERTYRLSSLVEKPGPDKTPSLLATVGSFLLTQDIWPLVEELQPGVAGELVLADAINELAKTKPVYGHVIDGVWHDAGSKMGYLEAVVDHALLDPKFGTTFRHYLQKRLQEE